MVGYRANHFLFLIFLRVLCNEFGIVEIIDLHSLAHICKSLRCLGTSSLATLLQDLIHERNILLILSTSLTHWLKEILHDVEEELLACAVPETTPAIMILHRIEILILRKELCKMLRLTESVEICEYNIALHMTRISDLKMLRIRIHAVDLLLDLFRCIGKIDTVAQ